MKPKTRKRRKSVRASVGTLSQRKSKSHIASHRTLSDILSRNENVAMLMGNGLNYAFYNSSVLSWYKLVAILWNETHEQRPIDEDRVKEDNLSLTETVEMAEKMFENSRCRIAEEFGRETPRSQAGHRFFEYLQMHNIPIITTNYDMNIVRELNLSQFYTHVRKGELVEPRFQWGRYYAKEEMDPEDILDKFAVWNAHGTIKAPSSICYSLTDYLECCQEAFSELEGVYSPFAFLSSHRPPRYFDTWLNLLLNKNLCIVGVSLEENEIFLRLLLMLRHKYMRVKFYNTNKYKGWYLYVKNREMPKSKRFFLESVNIRPVKCRSYDAIYKSF